MLDLINLQASSANAGVLSVIYTVLICFLLSTLIGVTYVKTFKGLSYSRSFVQAMILSSIVAATVMAAIGDSLARGLGMIGALAIIRFRTNFKDPRDIIFMFAALASGIGAGVGAYATTIVGTAGFVLTSFFLYYVQMSRTNYFDGMLRFNLEKLKKKDQEMLFDTLKSHCSSFALITLREMNQGKRLDYAYHVKLKRSSNNESLIDELQTNLSTIRGISLMLQETTTEL